MTSNESVSIVPPPEGKCEPAFFSKRSILVLLTVFWVWYVVAVVMFLWNGKSLDGICPVLLGPIFWIAFLLRKRLQNLSRRIQLPFTLKFFIVGILFFDVIMESFAVSFKGDLNPNIVLSDILWMGSCLGVLLAWWLLCHIYEFTPWQVFFLYGLKGAIVEQDYMVPLMILKGQWVMAFMLIPFLLVVYAVAVAPVFFILEPELPRTGRKPGLWAAFLGIFLSTVLFFGGASVWFKLMEYLFHLKAGG
jgi:hypothetical protein